MTKVRSNSKNQIIVNNLKQFYLKLFKTASPTTFLASALTLSLLVGPLIATSASSSPTSRQIDNSKPAESAAGKAGPVAALEADLNSIVQQHDNGQADGANSRQLAEAIIQRLMIDDVDSGEGFSSNTNNSPAEQLQHQQDNEGEYAVTYAGPSGPEVMKLKKLLSLLQSYENSYGSPGLSSRMYVTSQYPSMPSDDMATMKRAAAIKMNNYLQNQQQSGRNYARNNYDFGLGKRPDSLALRFGDAGVASGQPVSQFGKRPSAHRYDFGLGKRIASVSVYNHR